MKLKGNELRGFLTGLIIGDGTIDKGVKKRAFRIKSINKSFIIMIYNTLKENTNFNVEVKHYNEEIRDNIHHKEYWELKIKAHPYFAKLYHCFYNDYRKRIITKQILLWLTPQGIANWYLSDGYICLVGKHSNKIKDRRVELCTDAYTKTEVKMLQFMFQKRFNIETSLIKRQSTTRLRIKKSSFNTFFSLILPYVKNIMKYKLYLGYEQQPIWMSDDLWNEQILYKAQLTQTDNAVGDDIV